MLFILRKIKTNRGFPENTNVALIMKRVRGMQGWENAVCFFKRSTERGISGIFCQLHFGMQHMGWAFFSEVNKRLLKRVLNCKISMCYICNSLCFQLKMNTEKDPICVWLEYEHFWIVLVHFQICKFYGLAFSVNQNGHRYWFLNLFSAAT